MIMRSVKAQVVTRNGRKFYPKCQLKHEPQQCPGHTKYKVGGSDNHNILINHVFVHALFSLERRTRVAPFAADVWFR
jgi:hypothetical protein